MAKTANRPSEAHREWVTNKNGERVRNVAYRGGNGKQSPDRRKVSAAAAMGLSGDKAAVIYGDNATVAVGRDGSRHFVTESPAGGPSVRRMNSEGLMHAKFEPAEWSDNACGFYSAGDRHTTGAADVLITPDGDAVETYWKKGAPVSHDDNIAATGLNDLEDTATNTGRLSDENQDNVPLQRAYRSAIISVLSKRGGKNAAETEAASGAIVDKLIATGASKEDLVGRIADTLR